MSLLLLLTCLTQTIGSVSSSSSVSSHRTFYLLRHNCFQQNTYKPTVHCEWDHSSPRPALTLLSALFTFVLLLSPPHFKTSARTRTHITSNSSVIPPLPSFYLPSLYSLSSSPSLTSVTLQTRRSRSRPTASSSTQSISLRGKSFDDYHHGADTDGAW